MPYEGAARKNASTYDDNNVWHVYRSELGWATVKMHSRHLCLAETSTLLSRQCPRQPSWHVPQRPPEGEPVS